MTVIDTNFPKTRIPAGLVAPTTMAESGTESLQKGIIHTDISPRTARWMTILFLVGIGAVALLQLANEVRKHRPIQELDIARPPVHAMKLAAHGDVRDSARTLKHWLTKDNLSKFEDGLKENSILRQKIQPRMELAVAKYLGFGSNMAILGHEGIGRLNGWIFYQLGNDYVAGPGFLEPWFIHHRERGLFDDGENNVNADPRKAIIAFHQDCQAAGVHLIFMPVPVKQMLQPAEMSGRLDFDREIPPPNNADYARFISDLKAAGVDVFDPTPPTLKPDDPARYLEQDTHWTPEFMEESAKALVEHLRGSIPLPPPAQRFAPRVVEEQVSNIGDIVRTLKLPGQQKLFTPKTVMLHRVVDWQSDESADVLFLGDSFCNIYSDPQMHWGESAGLAQQVSRYLARPLDVIAINGQSASEVRSKLAQRDHPLQGKKVVVWEVAMHELSASNWPVIRIK
jgi:hypothetical protein